MEEHIQIILYCISTLLIILGFVALLTQKIYIDDKTKEPTNIDIPFIGKMKTNYPALIFIFAAVGIILITINKSTAPSKEDWKITGALAAKNRIANFDFREGILKLFPCDVETQIFDSGYYEISAKIDKGKRFSDIIQKIDYYDRTTGGRVSIIPKDEFDKYSKGEPSNIEKVTKNSIKYKTIELEGK